MSTIFEEAGEEEVDATIHRGGRWSDTFYDDEAPPEPDFQEDKVGKRPDRSGIRTSGENIIATAWFGAGALLVNKRIDPPVGRVLQLEAPLAAKEIDQAIAGTFLDKILQPLFKTADSLETVGAVIALPIMVGLYERKPALAPLLESQMKQTLVQVMLDVVPIMNKQKAKFRRTARQLSDVHEAFGIPLKDEQGHKVDPSDWLFNNWVFQADYVEDLPNEPEPAPEPTGNSKPKFQ